MSQNAAMWVSVAIFVITYALIILDKFDRAVVAISGAALMILFRIITQEHIFIFYSSYEGIKYTH